MLPFLQSSKYLKICNTFFLFRFTYICDMTLKKKQASEKKERKLWKSSDFWGVLGVEMKEWSWIYRGISRFQCCPTFKVGDGFMGVYPTLYSFIAILSMLTEWLIYLFIQQIYLYIESLVCARHVWGSENRRMNKVVVGPTFSEGVYCEQVHSGGNKQTGNDV